MATISKKMAPATASGSTNASTALHNLCEQYYQGGNKRINLGRNFTFPQRKGPLPYLAEHGDGILLAFLCDSGKFNIESTGNDGRTPLSWAARNGHEAVVRLLLERGANPESKDKSGWTSLSWAAASGQEAVVRLLIEKGAGLGSKDNEGRTPLSRAAAGKQERFKRGSNHGAVMGLLLADPRVNLNAGDANGRTPLSWAAGEGLYARVKLMLAKEGIDPVSKDAHGQTTLSWAEKNGHEAVVELLRSHCHKLS
jgi:ankyrin repeat protein